MNLASLFSSAPAPQTQQLQALQEENTLLRQKIAAFEQQSKYAETSQKAVLHFLTEEKSLKDTLQIERDRMQAMVSSMGEGVVVVDRENQINLINHTAESLLGLIPGQGIGKNWDSLVQTLHDGVSLEINKRPFHRAMNEGIIIKISVADDEYYEGKNGHTFPVASTTAPLFADKTIIGAIKVFRDVTSEKEETKRIEGIVAVRTKELEEEKARLTSFIEALPLGFFIVNPNHEILITNDMTNTMLGMHGKPRRFEEMESLFAGTPFSLKSVCNHCRSDWKTFEQDAIQFGTKNLKIFSVPVILHKEFLGTVVLIEDVTEAKILERSRDEFFSIASHELRTPLTAIRGNVSMIMDMYAEKFSDPDIAPMMKDIYESSIRLIGIVNDFLSVSRLELGKIEFKNVDVDVATVINSVLGELKAGSLNPAVDLRAEGIQTPIRAHADPDRLKEILINLTSNALKFTDHGEVVVSAAADGGMVHLRVRDAGRGIPQNNQSLLFHKFTQAENNIYTRDTTKGTGLGLYISKMLAEGMNATISLESSQEGSGSTFLLSLPVGS